MAILNIKNLPDSLYRKLKQRAKRQHRSVAQEVTHILERALAEPELLSLLELDGLGRDVWKGVDAVRHVEDERAAWD
jgi:plasmid stability protein